MYIFFIDAINNTGNIVSLCSLDRNLHLNVINHVRLQIHTVNGSPIPFCATTSPWAKQTDDSITSTACDVIDTTGHIASVIIEDLFFFFSFYERGNPQDQHRLGDSEILCVILRPKWHLNCVKRLRRIINNERPTRER